MLRLIGILLALFAIPAPAHADEAAAWQALRQGAVALIRHANAPGTGDPAGLRLDDCTTQRNLDEAGRAQSRRMGERFRASGVQPGGVLTSRWCRARETGALAFPGQGRDAPAFNSFFDERARAEGQTVEALAVIRAWAGPGALVVVTHQVNITAMTGVFPASGEAIVVRVDSGRLVVVGRLTF